MGSIKIRMSVVFAALSLSLQGQLCTVPSEHLAVQGSCSKIAEEEYLFVKGKKTRSYRKEFLFHSSGQPDRVLRTYENGRMFNTRYLYNETGKLTGWVNYSNEGVSSVSLVPKGKKQLIELKKVDIDGSLINQGILKFDKDCQLIEEQVIQDGNLVSGMKYEYAALHVKSKMELLVPDELGRPSKSIMNFYVYLDNGLLWKHYYTAEKLVKHEYRYPSFDSQGNWTVREDFLANKQNRLGKRVAVVYRTLTY